MRAVGGRHRHRADRAAAGGDEEQRHRFRPPVGACATRLADHPHRAYKATGAGSAPQVTIAKVPTSYRSASPSGIRTVAGDTPTGRGTEMGRNAPHIANCTAAGGFLYPQDVPMDRAE